jgi:general secretion pathway protein M
MRPLKRLEQRALALGLALLSLALVYLLGVHFWFSVPLLDTTQAMQPLRQAHEHYQTLLARRDGLQAQLAHAEDTPALDDLLLKGTDSGAAVAELMQLLASDVQAISTPGASCTVTNRMPATPNSAGVYVQVQIGVSLSCTIEPLAKLIYTLENHHPYLFIDTLSIHRNLAAESDSHLAVQMLITGYLRNVPAAGATP